MQNAKGQFVKGTHWRNKKPHWEKSWLENEYTAKQRSSAEIATDLGITEHAIIFWLRKHGIPRRNMSQVRAVKKWGAPGAANPMHGKRGMLNPNWRGGTTPFRQIIYGSTDWQRFSRAVRRRDKRCRLCGSTSKTDIHHIDPVSLAPFLVLDMGNVILLCKPCHHKIYGKELQWKKRLLKLLTNGKEELIRRATP